MLEEFKLVKNGNKIEYVMITDNRTEVKEVVTHENHLRFVDTFMYNANTDYNQVFESDYGILAGLYIAVMKGITDRSKLRQLHHELWQLSREVWLYWFTLCYYGSKKKNARKALRTLLIG